MDIFRYLHIIWFNIWVPPAEKPFFKIIPEAKPPITPPNTDIRKILSVWILISSDIWDVAFTKMGNTNTPIIVPIVVFTPRKMKLIIINMIEAIKMNKEGSIPNNSLAINDKPLVPPVTIL